MPTHESMNLDEAAAAAAFLRDLEKNGAGERIPETALSHLRNMMAAFDAAWPYEPGKPFSVNVQCCGGLERPYTYVVHAGSPAEACEKVREIHDDSDDDILACSPGVPSGVSYCWNDCRRVNAMLQVNG